MTANYTPDFTRTGDVFVTSHKGDDAEQMTLVKRTSSIPEFPFVLKSQHGEMFYSERGVASVGIPEWNLCRQYTPAAAERDVPQWYDQPMRYEIPQSNGCAGCPRLWVGDKWIAEVVGAVYLGHDSIRAAELICQRWNNAIARHAPKDDGAEDAAELRRQLDELEIASQEHVAYCCYDHHEDGATTIHLCDSDTKGAFKVYRRFLKADIDRLASPDPAKIDAAWREFIGATHGAPNTPPAKPDATQKWPRFWRCRDTNELWFCGSSSSPLMYRASGTSETVASNFTVETVWYAGNKAGDVYETDADGNELTQDASDEVECDHCGRGFFRDGTRTTCGDCLGELPQPIPGEAKVEVKKRIPGTPCRDCGDTAKAAPVDSALEQMTKDRDFWERLYDEENRARIRYEGVDEVLSKFGVSKTFKMGDEDIPLKPYQRVQELGMRAINAERGAKKQ